MDRFEENAPAKVNLTLRVLGRRADGFHEISSLAVFAGIGDRLELAPGDDVTLDVHGPFAEEIGDGDNLVLKAADLFLQHFPESLGGAFRLDKRLPVAAGLGGGSADAAAALRLLAVTNPGRATAGALAGMAKLLGSDVAVCLSMRPAVMRGKGDELTFMTGLPVLPAVLVNPGVRLGAGEVYEARGAALLEKGGASCAGVPAAFATADDLVRHIRETGNDLQSAAIKLAPAIAGVCAVLTATQGCQIAQMSGSGATCFGVYDNEAAAETAVRKLAAAHPDWWVCATNLGGK
jgi:4-diphosphocytidyl-2-C-methyl-D-erythritol kinase